LKTIPGDRVLHALAFAPDGKALISAGNDNLGRVAPSLVAPGGDPALGLTRFDLKNGEIVDFGALFAERVERARSPSSRTSSPPAPRS
jgi:hypothetical protein